MLPRHFLHSFLVEPVRQRSCPEWTTLSYSVLLIALLLMCSRHRLITDSADNHSRSVREIVPELCPSPRRPLTRHGRTSRTTAKSRGSHFMGYLDCLHREQPLKSHLWSLFSKLNRCCQVEFEQKLQEVHPRLTLQLKQCNERKVAQALTQFEIEPSRAP